MEFLFKEKKKHIREPIYIHVRRDDVCFCMDWSSVSIGGVVRAPVSAVVLRTCREVLQLHAQHPVDFDSTHPYFI